MKIRDKLYLIDNKTTSRAVNIDDTLYERLQYLSAKKYNAKISEIINVAIEEYIDKNKPTFYGKKENESVTYRNLMLRKNNIIKLNKYSKETGISFTRLVNGAINDFINNDN